MLMSLLRARLVLMIMIMIMCMMMTAIGELAAPKLAPRVLDFTRAAHLCERFRFSQAAGCRQVRAIARAPVIRRGLRPTIGTPAGTFFLLFERSPL